MERRFEQQIEELKQQLLQVFPRGYQQGSSYWLNLWLQIAW